MLTGKRGLKKSPIDVGRFVSLVHEASLREPCLPAPPDAVGRVNVVYMAANPPCCVATAGPSYTVGAGGRARGLYSSASGYDLRGRALNLPDSMPRAGLAGNRYARSGKIAPRCALVSVEAFQVSGSFRQADAGAGCLSADCFQCGVTVLQALDQLQPFISGQVPCCLKQPLGQVAVELHRARRVCQFDRDVFSGVQGRHAFQS